jgi:aminotransferase
MSVPVSATDGAWLVADRARSWQDPVHARVAPSHLPIIDLRGDELDRATAAHVVAAAAAALDRGETHYTSRAGVVPLRRAIAAQLARETGVEYDAGREVLIASGGQEGLYVAIQMLVRPGDDVLLADPGYPTYRTAVTLAGGNIIPIPVRAADGYGMTADAVAAALTPTTRLLILASPDNPTGGRTTAKELAGIAELAVAHDLRVLFDETYKAFVFDDEGHVSIVRFPGMRGRTVIVGSFSTTYAMTGWRVGYVAGDAALLGPITGLKLALSICAAAPSQWAALAAIEGPQDDVGAARDEIARRRSILLPALTAMGLTHGEPAGAYYAFADIRTTGLTSAQCAEALLAEAGVHTLPGSRFGPGGQGFLRFSMVESAPRTEEAMQRIAPVVARLRQGGGQT